MHLVASNWNVTQLTARLVAVLAERRTHHEEEREEEEEKEIEEKEHEEKSNKRHTPVRHTCRCTQT